MRIAQLLIAATLLTSTSACYIRTRRHRPPPPPPPVAQPRPAPPQHGQHPTQHPPAQRPPTQRPPTQRPPTQRPPTQRPPVTITLPGQAPRGPANSNDAGWGNLGRVVVVDSAQAATLPVSSHTPVRTVRFGAEGSSVELSNVVVVFDDGQRSALGARHFMRAGGRSQPIALPGGPRVIRQVEFRYRGITPSARRATVHVFGQ